MSDMAEGRKLLQFSVGPVHCCADSVAIHRIIEPPEHLVHLPGHTRHPAIFRHEGRVVSVIDMRSLFGLTVSKATKKSEKLIVVDTKEGVFGYWVDTVSSIVSDSDGKWGMLPSVVPRTLFDAAFDFQGSLVLHVDFEKLVDAEPTPWVYESGLYQETEEAGEESGADEMMDKITEPQPEALEPGREIVPEPRAHLVTRTVREKTVVQKQSQAKGDVAVQATQRVAQTPSIKSEKTDALLAGISKQEPFKAAIPQSASSVDYGDKPIDSAQGVVESAKAVNEDDNEENSGWLLIAIAGFLIVAGLGYLLLTYVSETESTTSVNSDSGQVIPVPPDSPESKPEAQSGIESFVPKLEETEIDSTQVELVTPDIEEVEEKSLVVTDKAQDAEFSNITREGDTVTITVYEAADSEMTAESTDAQEETKVPDEQTIVSLDKAETDMHLQSQAQEPLVEGLQIVWSHELQALRNAADDGLVQAPQAVRQGVRVYESLKPVLKVEEIVHIVVKGDTLWDIAKRYINDPFRYPELARLSKIKNPDLIYPGDRVLIRIIRHADQ